MKKKNLKTKKETVKKATEKRVVKKSLFKRIVDWFKSVRAEVEKVSWPSRKDMVKYSIATVSFVLFFAVYFYLITTVLAFVKSMI